MHISQIYTYPIKSLRPHALQEAELTKHGFRYDRRFMLLQEVDDNGKTAYKNMQVSKYPAMVLFHTILRPPTKAAAEDGTITVQFRPQDQPEQGITIPLCPDVEDADVLEVDMYTSKSEAYVMPGKYNDWFSQCFGYKVVLVYLGPRLRPVLMSTESETLASKTWLGAAAAWTGLGQSTPSEHITFADCAPYLVVSERSMDDVQPRLPKGEQMDITKFRPNIIVSGAEQPWEEDYWAELVVNDSTKVACVHNCGRCQSINIDFITGKPSTTESGKMLSKLQRDRRVDPGAKYSPVFGRYAFLSSSSEGHVIHVGDPVTVSRTNSERTIFDWDGLCTLPAMK